MDPGTLSACHGEAAGGGGQNPSGSDLSDASGGAQQAAKAQNEAGSDAEAKKAAQTAKRVRQALAKKQAKEAKKLHDYEEKFAAMEQARKLPPDEAEPIMHHTRDPKARPAPKRIAGGFRTSPPCGDCEKKLHA